MNKNAQQPMRQADFGRVCGCSAPVICGAAKPGKPLHAARLPDGRIDALHPSAVAYRQAQAEPERCALLAARQAAKAKSRATKRAEASPAAAPLPPLPAGVEIPDDPAVLADLTVREVVARYGSAAQFLDWLRAVKVLEDIQATRLRNAEREGQLVARELVRTHVLGAVDTLCVQLLSDTTRTIARRLRVMVSSGRDEVECERFVRDTLESVIKPAKARALRGLRP